MPLLKTREGNMTKTLESVERIGMKIQANYKQVIAILMKK